MVNICISQNYKPAVSIPNVLERDPTGGSGAQEYIAYCLNKATKNKNRFAYMSPAYPRPSLWTYNDPRWEEAFNAPEHDSCTAGGIDTFTVVDAVDVTTDDPEYCCQ